MTTLRLTAAQAMIRYLAAQRNGAGEALFAGVWAIFGHGNVAGLGEALYAHRDALPTWRGQNEQTMGHAAIAFAKQSRRRRMMAVTTSIGPGATNLVTAAATAHVNRLPLLLLPGDVFANRAPDPVLQQIEDFGDGTLSANDCLRPVSRYFDRISRPEHLLTALPRALRVLTDPADCGPATLAFCQDTQAEAYDYPAAFFEDRIWRPRRPSPDPEALTAAAEAIRAARRPVMVAGGGVHFAGATEALVAFAEAHGIPVVETQAGKSALAWDHPMCFGPIGVTGGAPANDLARQADLVIGVGTRFQDFTTGSWTLFQNPELRILALNIQPYDAAKRDALSLVADAGAGLAALTAALGDYRAPTPDDTRTAWFAETARITTHSATGENRAPTDMQVIGAVQRAARLETVVMSAAGTMPGELHKLWRAARPGGYHMEYGFSCMGYEIAGAMGIKMADPTADVICMLGDGSYLMANSELATAVMMGIHFTVIITDNRGFGCIDRLQRATGGVSFNNLLKDTWHETPARIDFAAHARSLGAEAVNVRDITGLEAALAERGQGLKVIVIETDPGPSSAVGGHWWDVAVPEVSERDEVLTARAAYEAARKDRPA